MSSIGSPSPFFLAGKKAYQVDRSLRFNDDDNAYLNRTPSGASNRTTFTLSVWVKRASNLDEFQRIFEAGADTSNRTYFTFDGDDKLEINHRDGGSQAVNLTTTAVFRDVSAWYHIVLAIDTTQGTSSNRIKIYVNGTQQTDFDTSTYPSSSKELDINSTAVHYIGRSVNNTSKLDGYLAEVNFIDGQAYDPSYFGETDVITGQWNPKKYVGSYGTNGFYLNFSDNSGTTATTLGKDSSGNGNNWTPNNFSVAANLLNDSMPDTPTNNFCNLNALNATNSFNFGSFDGGLVFDQSSNDQAITGTFFVTSGKWYWEIYKNSGQNPEIGICPQFTFSAQSNGSGLTTGVAFITNGGNLRNGNNGTASITGGSAQTGAGWIRIACDMDNKKIWFSDTSGNYFNSGNPATGANAAFDFSSVEVANGWTPYIFMGTGSGHNCYVNFGQFETNSFSSNIPAGFKTLSSANLPDPTILLPNKHFDTLLYTGSNSSSLYNVTGLEFQPDWVWGKSRNDTIGHILFDAVRGEDRQLEANLTDAEVVRGSAAYRFLSNGFAVSTVGNLNNPVNYVAWNWNAGDTDGKTYTVKVVSDGGNKYRFDDFGTSAVTLDLAEGGTYIFDQSDSSNAGHPLRFSTTSNGTHGGGSEYTTGVTTSGTPGSSGAFTQIVVAASAPTLYYYCTNHSGMGGQANTNSTLGSSNFDGSRQATTKVNATAGFSIVTSTSGGSSFGTYESYGHGLGVSPNVILLKNRDVSDNWYIYNSNFSTAYSKILQFNTIAEYTSTNNWGTSDPSSTTFSVNQGVPYNGAGQKMLAYCFSEVAGYSKFGSFVGNGNNDGPFIFLGFSAALIIYKNISSSGDWIMFDPKRIHSGTQLDYLEPNTSDSEGYLAVDILSNGFKLTHETSTKFNGNGDTFIYLAFAESPFKNARAR